ncbi:MAG: transporter substrate-binding domain-containing protein [Lachnospiraceae bacterium]|jgi:ABC-type amino acid transport substrate-binding protein|nr:transporter substrate-binding domain-containing protein [Lachnospiraceae bacterium]
MHRKKIFVCCFLIMVVMLMAGCSKVAQAGTTEQSEEVRKIAENRLEAILESKKIVIGISPDYAPFAFIAEKKEETYCAGSDIELGKYIAEQMGVEAEFREMEFEECLEAVSKGEVDLVLLGMLGEKDREEMMDFTNVYYRPGTQVILVKERQKEKLKTQEDFQEKTLAAQYGSLQAQLVVEQFPESYLNLSENVSGAVLMLRTGSVDGVVLEEALAGEMLREYSELARSEAEITYTPQEIVGGVGKGETELLERINEIINSVTEQNLYLHWIDEANELAASM